MQIRFNNGIVVEFPKGTPISTINSVERAITLPKPERDRILRKHKAKLTTDNFVEVKDFAAFRKEVRQGITNVTKLEGPEGEKGEKGGKGDKGEDGKDGIDGKDGLDGNDGLDGADGKDGEKGDKGDKGEDGIDGQDGEDADVDDIIEIINSSDELINFSAISGFGQLQEDIERTRVAAKGRTFFANGTKMGDKTNTNFVAGSNITLTHNVANDANNLTISAGDMDVAALWGNITGTLSDQTDLQAALDAKGDMVLADAQTVTGAKTFNYDALKLSNLAQTASTAVWSLAGSNNTLFIPDFTSFDTVVAVATVQTLSNKTLTSPVLDGTVTGTANLSTSGAVTGSNLSGTNTGDQDLTPYSLEDQAILYSLAY